MQVANVRLRLNKNGSDIPLFNVTPAEAVILHVLHQGNNGGMTFGEQFEKIEVLPNPAFDRVEVIEEEKIVPGSPEVPGTPSQEVVGTPDKPGYKPFVPGKAFIPATPDKTIPAVTKPIPRTNAEEIARLRAKYGFNVTKKGDQILEKIYPGLDPTLPQTFKEIKWQGVQFNGNEIAPLNLINNQPMPN